MKIDFEDWQVKQLREHFGYNDSTQTSHWAYPIFHKAYNDIKGDPDIISRKEIRELRLENKRLEDIIKGLRLEILYIKNSGNIYS